MRLGKGKTKADKGRMSKEIIMFRHNEIVK